MGGNSSKVDEKSRSASPNAAVHNTSECLKETAPLPLHLGPIYCLCPAGQDFILSGGADENINLYCWGKNHHEAKFKGPVKDVTKICYNNNSKTVHAASRDRSLYAWKWPREEQDCISSADSQTGHISEPTAVLQGHTLGVTALGTSDEHPQLLCSGSRDNSVCLWDLVVGKPVSSMYAPRNLVTDLKWIVGEKSVVQSSEDKTLRVWDLTTCSTVQHFRAKNYLQTCCDVSSDRQQFLAGSSGSGCLGGELTLWDRRNEKKPLREFKGHAEGVESCLFLCHQDTQLVASVGRDSTICLWELDSGKQLHCQHLSEAGPLTCLISPDREILGCSSYTGGISLWALETDVDKSSTLSLISKYV